MSVYLARSADSPTISGRSSASRASAWPNGALVVRWPGSANEAIIADVVSVLAVVGVVVIGIFLQLVAGDLPLVLGHAHEVRLLPGLQQRHAAADAGVADQHRGRAAVLAQRVERGDERGDVVAVDAQGVPAERAPLVGDGLGAQHARGGAVGLQRVDVDDRGEVVQAVVGGLQRGLPGRALVELAVGEQVVDAGRVALVAQPERHPGGDGEAVAERAAGDLHARRVGRHAGHRQPGAVGAVGRELLDRDRPGLGQRGVERDGVVADGEQEPVAVGPVRVLGPVAELVGVDHGEHVGDAERLADVALALHLAHVQRVAADAVGGLADRRSASTGRCGVLMAFHAAPVVACSRELRGCGWTGAAQGAASRAATSARSARPQVSRVTRAAIRPSRP